MVDVSPQMIVFRTDASLQIGTGHIMRCLTLADALAEAGADCQFICRAHSGNLADLIYQRGYRVHLLPFDANWVGSEQPTLAHAAWLGSDWKTDAEQSKRILSETICNWLIVDHYALDQKWELALKPCCRQLMAIDDLADRPHACDLLLDQNWHGYHAPDRYDTLVAPSTTRLLGPDYALLKPEYGRLRSLISSRDGRVRRILVFMGGSDPSNQTAKALQALMTKDLSSLSVDVVIGTNHPDPIGIAALAGLRPATTVHQNLPNLADLMAYADLMISGGGSTTWERMCLGLPCLVISIAENQTPIQKQLAESGFSRFLGEMAQVKMDEITDAVRWAISHPSELAQQSKACQTMVSGSGAAIVANFLKKYTYTTKP